MDLKTLVCNYFKCGGKLRVQLDECRDYNSGLIADKEFLLSSVSNAEVKLQELNDELIKSTSFFNQLVSEKKALMNRVNQLSELLSEEKGKSYSGKLTTAKVRYGRRLLTAGGKTKVTLIDVRNFITPNNFWIYDDIQKNHLFIFDQIEIDSKAVKLYYLAKKDYNYITDQEQFGFGEVWLFPFELHELKGDDCEGWASMIGSYFACAGIPRDRWWVSAGKTRNGGGHCSVYVKDDSGKWRHLNSTNQKIRNAKYLTDFPLNSDESDKSGIEKFWFSFNDLYSVTSFEDLKENGFFSGELNKKIRIEGNENV